ncbi:MAG: ThiF family adenylyltransferase [Gammaproteobacteria bacterium]|nr:ThiF family adenylyltransferase [Gammaproteobacteria bacterium]
MTVEELVRNNAEKRGWTIVRRPGELGVAGVPCFVTQDIPGRCEIWVGVGNGSDQLQAGLDWQSGNVHVADIRGLKNGAVYDRLGNIIGNVIREGDKDSCTISIKKDEGEYLDAWDALKTYMNAIYGGFRAIENVGSHKVERPYTFPILGGRSRDEVQWLDLVRGEKMAIVGLGGVGAWIADLLTKADVAEVHGWDGDVIEAKNIIRMPGAVNPDWIGKPKAEWFEETYRQIHRQVHGHPKYVDEQTAVGMCSNATFGFVAVDNDEGRKIACGAMAAAGIPFIDVGISLNRRDGQVRASIRVTTVRPHDDAWRKAIPKVDKAGQQTYGKLELPDVAAVAAGMAVQSWRKVRGQTAQESASECMVYRTEADTITVRARG